MARINLKRPRNILILVAILALVFTFAYLSVYLSALLSSITHSNVILRYNLSGYSRAHNILFYNQSTYLVPYYLVNYNYQNISNIYVSASVYNSVIPKNVYLANTTNECINCVGIKNLYANLSSDLVAYGVINTPSALHNISLENLTKIKNNSILIIPTGILPSQLFNNATSNTTVLQSLLKKGESIIYVGGDLRYLILPQSIEVINKNLPYYLGINRGSNYQINTSNINQSAQDFYFQNATYSFASGHQYGPITYINQFNGSFVAFPNYPNTWPDGSLPLALAKGVSELFWLPKLASGINHVTTKQGAGFGSIGVYLSNTTIKYNQNATKMLNATNTRILLYSSPNYSIGKGFIYKYLYYQPQYQFNGSVALPGIILPSQGVIINITLFTHFLKNQTIQPNINIRDQNNTIISSRPLPYTKVSENFSFIQTQVFNLPPGKYIYTITSFSGYNYASGLLYVPSIQINPINANFTNGTFLFYLTMAQQPINNVNYTLSIDKNYSSTGIINQGLILYKLPQIAKEQYGNVSFNLAMLGKNFTFGISNPAINFSLTNGDIDLGIVVIIVIVLFVFVKDPIRDDFYVDVPEIPQQKRIPVAIKQKDFVGVFDKLNTYYHWRYMPLTIDELRAGISNNIRENGIPLLMTHQNIEMILNSLVERNILITIGSMYAPATWLEKSAHDLTYLTTFKKLRIWFIAHGYLINDMDASNSADIVATTKGERIYLIIYSETSKFVKMPIYKDAQTYLVFIDADAIDLFSRRIADMTDIRAQQLKLYISYGYIKLLDAEHPEKTII